MGLRPEQGGAPLPAIHFGGWTGARIHVAYQLEPDDWNGRRSVQLLVRYWVPAG
jgi:single-stranded-DNA-specific exonuclease